MTFPDSPVRRARPGTVTAAVFALYAMAVLSLVGMVLQLLTVGRSADAIREYGRAVNDTATADALATVTQVSAYVIIAISLLFAIGYVLLGVFNSKGSNAARISTWVLLGLSLCCGAGLLGLSTIGSGMGGGGQQGNLDQAELQRRIEAALPGWYTPVTITLGVVSLLLAIAAIILLALPASNDYFRKPEASAWEPPVPGGGGYPPAGGQPGFGAPPATPGYGTPPGYGAPPDQSGYGAPPDQSGYGPPPGQPGPGSPQPPQ
jgi:hypothetical protein